MSGDGGSEVAYEVAVAVIDVPATAEVAARTTTPPGFDEALGLRGRHIADARSRVVALGDEAARIATEQLAKQVGVAAQRFAEVLEQQPVTHPGPGELGVESVQVSFGVTLTGGVQALFTAQAESSAQVTITLTRRPTR